MQLIDIGKTAFLQRMADRAVRELKLDHASSHQRGRLAACRSPQLELPVLGMR